MTIHEHFTAITDPEIRKFCIDRMTLKNSHADNLIHALHLGTIIDPKDMKQYVTIYEACRMGKIETNESPTRD